MRAHAGALFPRVMEKKIMKLLIFASILLMMFAILSITVRRIRAARAFKAKRRAVYFRQEPFLWMRRIL